jgi:hypothetical protein
VRARRFLVVLGVVLVAAGCVRRTVTINTDPQGAVVTLNDDRIGTSPVSVDFTFYGDYDVILQKQGYETLHTHQRLKTPWYETPGVDFFTEALVPFTVHDRQQMSFTMEPAKPIDSAELKRQAQEFRERALYEEGTGRHPNVATNPAP